MLDGPSRDTPEGLLADVATTLLALLFVHPDAPEICVPRAWVAAWYQDVATVLDALRHPY